MACDVMSRLSDPHLMKLATYALLPVNFCNERRSLLALLLTFFATIVCFSLSFASFSRRCFLGGLSIGPTALFVYGKYYLIKNQNMAQIQGGHCPWSKIHGGQPITLTPPCRAPDRVLQTHHARTHARTLRHSNKQSRGRLGIRNSFWCSLRKNNC